MDQLSALQVAAALAQVPATAVCRQLTQLPWSMPLSVHDFSQSE